MSNRTHWNHPLRAMVLVLSLVATTFIPQAPVLARVAPAEQLMLKGDASAIQLIADGTAQAVSAIAADIDDDGASDVIVGLTGTAGSAILVWRGNASLVYPATSPRTSDAPLDPVGIVRSVTIAPNAISLRDSNGDGRLDVIASGDTEDATVILAVDDPSLEAIDVSVPATKSASEPLTVSGRLNSDGIPDVVSIDRSTFVATATLSKLRGVSIAVTDIGDSGPGTLRQAIIDANGSPGADTISFNIGTVSKTIVLSSALPFITETVEIDGTTQPAYDGVPLVEVSGGTSGPAADGFVVQAASTVIRGLAINEFGSRGIVIQASGCIVEGNHIGVDLAGNVAKGNGNSGVAVELAGVSTIGGLTSPAMNVISGNAGSGIVIVGVGASSNAIIGNRIGTNRGATAVLPNGVNGVSLIAGANSTSIGGATAGARNVISGNTVNGILVSDTVSGVTIENNSIGADLEGTVALANQGNGILMAGLNNVIQSNRIRFNVSDGIAAQPTATGVTVTANAMAGNGGLAIDLNEDGVTANDVSDADGGANGLQNFPVVTDAVSVGGTTVVKGTIASMPNSTYRIEFFVSAGCSSSGNGEGDVFLGFVNVATDVNGDGAFTANLAAVVTSTQSITATATDEAGSTSEFSACVSALTAADISMTINGVPDPVAPGSNIVYTVTVVNAGPLDAANVVFLSSVPSGTVFTSAATTQGVITAPTPGGVGAIMVDIGTILDDGTVVITIVVEVVGPPTLTITHTGFVSTTTPEISTANNTDTASNLVIAPPVITSISKVSGEPFRIRILGAAFQPGVVVFIASDASPWPSVKMKDSATLTLKKGSPLKSRFPKGVPVTLRVVNPDGGQASMSYTR